MRACRWGWLFRALDALEFQETWLVETDGPPSSSLTHFASRYSRLRGRSMKSHTVKGGILFVRVDREFAPASSAASASPAGDQRPQTATSGCGHQHEAA